MFAAPNMRDVEAQQAAQPAYGQTDYKTTTGPMNAQPQNISGNNPAMIQQQGAGTSTAGSGSADIAKQSTVNRMAQAIEWGGIMLLLAWFSMVEMIAAAQICGEFSPSACWGTRGYQVAVGVVSLSIAGLCGICFYLELLTNTAFETAVSVFLFLWWTAGVIVLTFFGDFQLTTTAAGYFGTWVSFGLAVLAVLSISENIAYFDKNITSVRKPIFVLTLASLVNMGAAIGPCSGTCSDYNAYAIVLSVVSLFVGLVMFFFPRNLERKFMQFVAAFLVLWWIFGAAVITLGGPQTVAGNGFFSAWIALIASVAFAAELRKLP